MAPSVSDFVASGPWASEFLALALVHFLAVIAPGPDFAVTVRQSVLHGRWIGIATALGIGLGMSVHVVYTLLGMGALLHTAPWVMRGIQLLGAGYLLYLGISAWRSPSTPGMTQPDHCAANTQASWPRALWTGFLTNATNPKATLFFLAVFTTMVSPQTPMAVQSLYGLWMCCTTALWFVVVSIVFSHTLIRQQFVKLGRWFERTMGAILVALAVKLLTFSF